MFKECVTHVTTTLANAGIAAVTDARDLPLPGVWVTPDNTAWDSLANGRAAVTLALVLVTSSTGVQALADLDELLDSVTGVLTTAQDWTAASIRLPNHAGSTPLPCLRGTITLDWSRDE